MLRKYEKNRPFWAAETILKIGLKTSIPRPSNATGGLLLIFNVVQWTIPTLSTDSITKIFYSELRVLGTFPFDLRFTANRSAPCLES